MTTAAPDTAKTTTEAGDGQQPKPEAAPEGVKPEGQQPETKPAAAEDPQKGQNGKPKVEPKFDLKLPDGSHLTQGDVDRVLARAKAENLTPEQAQAELNRESDLVKTFAEGQKQKLDKEVAAWVDQTKADPEIGGDKFAESAESAKRIVQRFGTEAFKKALNETGLGNHPELIRVFARIWRAVPMAEDKLVLASGQPTPPKSAAEVLYGESSKTS